MATLRGWIKQFETTTSEKIDTIVLGGDDYSWGYRRSDWPQWNHWNVAVPVGEVPAGVLDQEFGDSWGGNESPNLCAWSPSWVLFSDNYDGAERPCWVPRQPVDHMPTRPGGG